MFQIFSLKMEQENCSCTIRCLQSNLSLDIHKQLSAGSEAVCAMYWKSDLLTTLSELACVPRSLVFGALPDTGSPRVPGRAFPSLHMVQECVLPLFPCQNTQRTDPSMDAAELRIGRGMVLQQLMVLDFQISGFFSCVFLSSSSCYSSETDLNMSLIYQLHFKEF